MKTILIGLGNPILGDDGVGWKVAEEVSKQERDKTNPIEVDYLSLGGLALMERLLGYDQVILVDAIQTGQHSPGTISVTPLEDLPQRFTGHMGSAHDVNLQTALQLGREMGSPLPYQVLVVGIEAERIYDFSEELSPVMTMAIPEAVQIIQDLLHGEHKRIDHGIT